MKFNIRRSFALKLSLYMMTCVVIIFVGVLVYNYRVSKKIILEDTLKQVKDLENFASVRIGSIVGVAKSVSESMASFIEFSNQTEVELLRMLRAVVETHPVIYGSTVSFEPYKFNKDKYYFGPYFSKSENGIKYAGDPEYDYFKFDWYTTPKKLGHGIWGEPYFDENEKKFMVTYSQPIYKNINGIREFYGVVACDVELDWLEGIVFDICTNDSTYASDLAFIVSPQGNFIAHPDKRYYTKGKDFFLLTEEGRDPVKRSIWENMIAGKTGFMKYFSNTLNKSVYVYYEPLKVGGTGWSLGILIPEDELFSDLNTITLNLFIIGLVGYVLTLLFIIALASRMTMPLRSLANATYKIGKGDFNVKLPLISSVDEVGVLSHSFRTMQENLIKYVTNLQETTAAKEKIEKELSIAREIQQGLLPHKFPHLKQVDLYATLIPAREVGGDLYDFFFIDEKHLCFAIGDVAGKGVPAALFMAVTKTLLRAKLSVTMDISKVLNDMNKDLCKDNDSSMFVTFFLGMLNIETGLLEYCSAGHNPPLIYTAKKGYYYFHAENSYPPLGIVTDANYVGSSLNLLEEDILFLYTDGVTEAMDINNVQFSEEKLLGILTENKDETMLNIINNVKVAVEQHSSATVQSDDITMLIFKYWGQMDPLVRLKSKL